MGERRRERPILFSGPMVRAILAGRKTVTRRVVKPQPPEACRYEINGAHSHALCLSGDGADMIFVPPTARSEDHRLPCPYGPGDRLWVRETFAVPPGSDLRSDVAYRADLSRAQEREERSARRLAPRLAAENPWTPSIYMPRWACRLVLEVTDVRVERLHDITEEDARAEGVEPAPFCKSGRPNGMEHVEAFECLWDSINAKRAPWAENPWVWRVAFRRLNDEEDGNG